MPWLVRDGEVLASLDVADSRRARRRGLLGRDGYDGALLLTETRSVHSFGMRFPLDVAFLDDDCVVVRIVRLRRWRMTRRVHRARHVLETQAGTFREWGLQPGDRLEVKG